MSDSVHIILSGFEDQNQIHVSEEGAEVLHINESEGIPKYVGARAEVTRIENGVKIKLVDYTGATEETVYEAIADIVSNDDGSLTFVLPDGREITTDSLTGPAGTTDYEELENRPQIEGNVLTGNKTFEQLGLVELSNSEIQNIINSLV